MIRGGAQLVDMVSVDPAGSDLVLAAAGDLVVRVRAAQDLLWHPTGSSWSLAGSGASLSSQPAWLRSMGVALA